MAEDLQQLKSFPLFPTLPEELRIQIFEAYISLSPRIIEVCQRPRERERDQGDYEHSDVVTASEAIQEEPTPDSTSDILTIQNLSLTSNETESSNTAAETQETSASSSSSSSSDVNQPLSLGLDVPGEEEEFIRPPNPNPYYTSTPPPALLHTSRLAREVALRHYTLSFPNHGFHPAKIYYNPRVDTLYFPSWSFHFRLTPFENSLSGEVKDTITRIAIDNLMWASTWTEGTLNDTFQIDQFRNVQELVLVARGKGTVCGCCMEFDGPEEGIVGFKEVEVKGRGYEESCVRDCGEQFRRIREKDWGWNVPEVVRCVYLLRDGVMV